MKNQRFASVWDAIEDTLQSAKSMQVRSLLMMTLKSHIKPSEVSQTQAAKQLGVPQRRIADLMRGKIDAFNLDSLLSLATAAGLRFENAPNTPAR